LVTPWGPIGFITFVRTYARWVDEKHQTKETFEQLVERVIKACRTQLKVGFTEEEENRLRFFMLWRDGFFGSLVHLPYATSACLLCKIVQPP
jgi:hypothetical protein